MSQIIKTGHLTYTPMEVIDTFSQCVQIKNIRTLVEHLSNPHTASEIEGFIERGTIYFIIQGEWLQAGKKNILQRAKAKQIWVK